MPIMSGLTAIAGAASNDNILAGQPFEFLPFDALVSIGLSFTTSGTLGDLIADVYSGSDILCSGMRVPNAGNIDISRDLWLEDEAMAGDRLVIKVRNTTAGTSRDLIWLVKIEPL